LDPSIPNRSPLIIELPKSCFSLALLAKEHTPSPTINLTKINLVSLLTPVYRHRSDRWHKVSVHIKWLHLLPFHCRLWQCFFDTTRYKVIRIAETVRWLESQKRLIFKVLRHKTLKIKQTTRA
jgi:hypothetical protein